MELTYHRCCILDVSQQGLVACLRLADPLGPSHKEVRKFGVLPSDLAALSEWLAAQKVTHVAIESSGRSWKPIGHALQPTFTVLLINVASTTDVSKPMTGKDIEWVADLLAWGLVPSNEMPPSPHRELPRRHKPKLIAIATVMFAALLTAYGLWRSPDGFSFPLLNLDRRSENIAADVWSDAPGDRASSPHFDRAQQHVRHTTPSPAEDSADPPRLEGQAARDGERRLPASVTAIKPKAPLVSPSAMEPRSPPSSHVAGPLPPGQPLEKDRLIKILGGEPSSAPSAHSPEPLRPNPLPDKDCLLKMLKEEPC